VRDAAGLVLDIKTDFILNGNQLNQDQKVGSTVLRIVNQRANSLNATQLLEDAAFDKYSFLRDSYLQRRRNQVYDGNPPASPD